MIAQSSAPHQPIMVDEILQAFDGKHEIVDMTFGAGGHSRALLQADASRIVYAIDQDPHTEPFVSRLQQEFPRRVNFVLGNFSNMVQSLKELGIERVDGVLMDIGVSSMQLDTPERGFSFRAEGPLEMRMSAQGLSAEEVINDYSAEELTKIIRTLGEEPMARAIVKNILRHRERGRITTTTELAAIIHEVKQRRGAKIDPATRTFQAIRMHVNDELGALAEGLLGAEAVLSPGGVLAVMSFHSLEDRLVKRFLKSRLPQPQVSRHLPPQEMPEPIFTLLRTGAVKPSREENIRNPRARSARLRLAQRTAEGRREC